MCYRQTNTNTFKHTDRRVYDVYSQSHLKRGYDNSNPIPRDGFATEIYFVFEEKNPTVLIIPNLTPEYTPSEPWAYI